MNYITLEELKNKYLGDRGEVEREIHELEMVLDLVQNHSEELELIETRLKEVINNLKTIK